MILNLWMENLWMEILEACPILTLEHATHFNSASIWLVLVILLQTEFWKVKYQNGGNKT